MTGDEMTKDRSLRRLGNVLRWSSPVVAVLLVACGSDDPPAPLPPAPAPSPAPDRVQEVRTLSNRADMISGGDVLAEVVLKSGQEAARVKVALNGADVTGSFAIRSDGRFKALLTGLRSGDNELAATYSDGPGIALTVTNHSIGGPIFSGPQITPWICETGSFGLGPSTDAQCNAPTQVRYVYKSTDPAKVNFLPYDLNNRPTDVASVMADTGATVPFIVRVETGTANRGIYVMTFVADPDKNHTPFDPPLSWNGALIYSFQGGALPQYRQGPIDASKIGGYNNPTDSALLALAAGTGLDSTALAKGYAVVNNTLNHFAQNTNSVVSAETAIMMKEKVAETLGEIKYTIGTGASGGSMQQHLLLNSYPGIIDGALPGALYPDVWSSNTEVQDCSLLARYFDANAAMWSNVSQQNAVFNNANELPGTCRAWVTIGTQYGLDQGWNNPASAACFTAGGVLRDPITARQAWMYDPVSNPNGARCTLQDYQVNIFGRRASDRFAERPYDNVGVQYGLNALKAGVITVEQFVHMNENVGGRDINWNWMSARTVATTEALERVYRSGQYNLFNNAATTPLIDVRGCTNLEIHSCYQSFKLRERVKEATGSNVTSVIFINKPGADMSHFLAMEKWVKAVKADAAAGTLAEKVARNRPAEAVDSCWISGVHTTDMTACLNANPYYGEPRGAAGSPISAPAAKCQLAPLDRSAYGVTFTDAEWSRLQAVFPAGACDWSKPGVGQAGAVPWLSYAAGPGGQAVPPPPASRELQ